MVLVNGRVLNGRLHAAGPLDGRCFHHLVRTQSKHASEGVGDAVALTSTHLADHGAKVPSQHHFRTDSVFVRNNPFEVESNPVVFVAIIQPEDVVVAVIR